jgi:hypothetical protein
MQVTLLRCAAVACLALGAAARADVVTDWNAHADAIAVENKLSGPAHARDVAIMHVAIFEAVNAIDRRYAPYRLKLIADRNTSREAAAAAAGHAVLLSLFPDQRAALDSFLAQQLAAVAEGDAKERGLILGRKAAAELLELRADDGFSAPESWRPVTQPGVYVPTTVAAGSTVAAWSPWVMSSAAQFRPAPPPALSSKTWTRDVNEIREVGALNSKSRSAEQTSVARFWFLVGPRTWSPLVAQVAAHKRMDLLDCARLFALTSMAGTDAYISVFDAKYRYNFWRPLTAIRNADLTGNPETPRDAGWLPLGETPMHPEYPCAHCISAAAVATVLSGVAGDDIGELTLTSATAPGVTRRWSSLKAYSDEVSSARIWAGFHYRFSTEVGQQMGRKIGDLTLATQLKPQEP